LNGDDSDEPQLRRILSERMFIESESQDVKWMKKKKNKIKNVTNLDDSIMWVTLMLKLNREI
jgi:hypothetical protein